ncbi:MAG: acyltransferase family protein, partial [Actinomycetes bacterium]
MSNLDVPEGVPESAGSTNTVSRILLLDLMRTVALYRVVVFHVTSIDALSIVAAMPVMFFVAGSLVARTLDRRSGRRMIVDRFRRILIPLWVYAATITVIYGTQGMLTSSLASVRSAAGWITQLGLYDTARLFVPVLSLGAPVGPGTPNDPVYWTWVPLWYLHTHLLLVLAAPLLYWAYKRRPMVTIGVLVTFWLLDVVANQGNYNIPTFYVFFVVGFAFNDGRLLKVPR